MAKDIFPGWGKGPSKDEIEREAARELERLTRQAGPSPYDVDAGPSVGGLAPGAALEGPSRLEEIAFSVAERRRQRKRGKGLQPIEDPPSGYGGGFAGPAAISGSVGSSLGFGGGAAPGTRKAPPPPDAQPLRRRTTAPGGGAPSGYGGPGGRPPQPPYGPPPEVPTYGRRASYDDDDDDIGVTEMALRDHAERFGVDLSDKVISSDPIAAESMRDEAMRRFMEQQASRRPAPSGPNAVVPGGLRIRRPGGRPRPAAFARLRVAGDADDGEGYEDGDEHAAGDGAGYDEDERDQFEQYEEEDEEQDDEEQDDEDEDEDEEPQAHWAHPSTGRDGPRAAPPPSSPASSTAQAADRRARIAEQRLEMAEERARVAEKRAAFAEARAQEAEREVQELSQLVVELETMLEEAGAHPGAVAEQEDAAPPPPPAPPAPPPRPARPDGPVRKKVKPKAAAAPAPPVEEPTEAPAEEREPEPEAQPGVAPAVEHAPDATSTDGEAQEPRPPPVRRAPKKAGEAKAPASQPKLGGVLGRRLAEKRGGKG